MIEFYLMLTTALPATIPQPQQGLRANAGQFWLLVLVNAFVGSMVGLERSILPAFGKEVFGIEGKTALLSFLVAFGSSKALFNLVTGQLVKRFTRKKILLLGWIAAIPVPFLLMYAPSWGWVIAANVFLGINQGLAWSSTVIMKIDLVGEKNRGLAMGINEFAGYVSVGLAAYLAATIAAAKGYAFFPFVPGIAFSLAGVFLTLFFVKDTLHLVRHEAVKHKGPLLPHLWSSTSFSHPNLGSVTLNGLVNNLNDGVIWGLLPVFLLQKNFSISQVGIVAGVYPAVWGLGQLFTGRLGDAVCKKQVITAGMWLQAIGLAVLAASSSFLPALLSMVLMGIGTAMVYPNFLSEIATNTHPLQRAESLSIFRFWRDSGYVIGALVSGVLADQWGIPVTLVIIAMVTAAAGLVAHIRMCCTNKILWPSQRCVEVF
jgi:MFS family permease